VGSQQHASMLDLGLWFNRPVYKEMHGTLLASVQCCSFLSSILRDCPSRPLLSVVCAAAEPLGRRKQGVPSQEPLQLIWLESQVIHLVAIMQRHLQVVVFRNWWCYITCYTKHYVFQVSCIKILYSLLYRMLYRMLSYNTMQKVFIPYQIGSDILCQCVMYSRSLYRRQICFKTRWPGQLQVQLSHK
jgi:hypothetical protein